MNEDYINVYLNNKKAKLAGNKSKNPKAFSSFAGVNTSSDEKTITKYDDINKEKKFNKISIDEFSETSFNEQKKDSSNNNGINKMSFSSILNKTTIGKDEMTSISNLTSDTRKSSPKSFQFSMIKSIDLDKQNKLSSKSNENLSDSISVKDTIEPIDLAGKLDPSSLKTDSNNNDENNQSINNKVESEMAAPMEESRTRFFTSISISDSPIRKTTLNPTSTTHQDTNMTNSFALLPKKKSKNIALKRSADKKSNIYNKSLSSNDLTIQALLNQIPVNSENSIIANTSNDQANPLIINNKLDLAIDINSNITSVVASPNQHKNDFISSSETNSTRPSTSQNAKYYTFQDNLQYDLNQKFPLTTKNSDSLANIKKNIAFEGKYSSQSVANSDNETYQKSLIFRGYDKDTNFLPQQALIRKNKKNMQRIHELMKYQDFFISEDEGYTHLKLNGSIKIIEDPLERFDQEYLKILSFLDANELESVMPVTYNSDTHSYSIKITSINTFREITRSFYKSIEMPVKPKCIMGLDTEFLIGSSGGTILIFDLLTQSLKTTLGIGKESEYGSIVSFDMIDEKFLISGHENGNLVIWDYLKKTSIRTIHDIHRAPIVCIKIIMNIPLMFISIDSDGNVVLIELEKLLLYQKVEKHYIFSQNTHMYVFDMKILNRDVSTFKKVNYVGDELIIIAFSCLKNIHFITLEPSSKTIKSLYKFIKPSFVQERSVPTISWCNNIFNNEEEKNKYFILIGWGNSLSLLEFDFIGKIPRFKSEGVIKMHFEVIYAISISYNLIFAIASESNNLVHSIHVIHSSEFKKTLIENNTKDNNNNLISQDEDKNQEAVVIYNELLDDDYKLSNQQYIKDQNSNLFWSYNNSISLFQNSYECIILGNRAIYRIKIITWKEYLDQLIYNSVWKMFLSIGLEILKHNVKELADIPDDNQQRRDILIPYFKEKLLKYAEAYLLGPTKKNYNNEALIREVTKTIIDFCIEANMENFLFIEIKKIYNKSYYNHIFLSTLEPFIKANRLNVIPSDSNNCQSTLREIVYYYASPTLMKRDLMQQMISNLNLKTINTDEIINLCLELNLYIALIYICTQSNDFITPLIRFIGLCSKAQREGKNEDLKLFGSRCLWYIKMCFKRKMIGFYKDIPVDEWKEIIHQILILFLADEYLKIFFNILNPAYTINIIAILFEESAAKILESPLLNEETKGHNHIVEAVDIHKNIHYETLETLIDVLIDRAESEAQRKKNKLYISFICAKMIQYCKIASLDEQFCLEAAEYILKMHSEFDELIIINFKIMLPTHNAEGERIDQIAKIKETLTENYIFESKSNMILALLKYSENLLSKNEEISKKFIKSLELSPFIEPLCYLLSLRKEYVKALDKLLQKNAPEYLKARMIDWILEILDKHSFEKDKYYQDFSNYVIERIQELVSINPEKVKDLIDMHFKTKEKIVIMKLKDEPELQIQLLEKILAEKRPQEIFDEELIDLHIHLLCKSPDKNRRKNVIKKLQEYESYTPNCLEYCRKYQIKDAWAYLEEKFGGVENLQRAIDLKFEIFYDYFGKCASRKTEISIVSENKIKNKFRAAVNTLKMHSEHSNWFFYLQKCGRLHNDMHLRIEQSEKNDKLKRITEELVEDLLLDIVKTVEFNVILEEIKEPSSCLNSDLLKKFFKKIISNNYFEYKLRYDTRTLTQYDLMLLANLKLLPQTTKPLSLKTNCNNCQEPLQNQKCYTFACGHSFHVDGCINEPICCICSTSEQSIISRHIIGKYNKKNQSKKKVNPQAKGLKNSGILEKDNDLNKKVHNFDTNRSKMLLKLMDEERNREIRSLFEYASQKILKKSNDNQHNV